MKLIFETKKDGEDKIRRALKADDAFSVLWDLQEAFRNDLKYSNGKKTTEEWQKLFLELMQEQDIDLEREYP